jgi:hypothetical protein
VSKILLREEVTTYQPKNNKTVNSTDWDYFPIGAIDLKARKEALNHYSMILS